LATSQALHRGVGLTVAASLRGASVAPGPTSAARITAANLRVDAATAEVLRRFEVVGVESLLLKGVSVTRWLSTPSDPRHYVDCDLLVRPADLTAAERILGDLGFSPIFDQHDMPSWWRAHATTWAHEADVVTVDLHQSLVGVGVDPESLWLTLSRHAETIVVAGYPAQTLTIPGRAFHLALHAAQHGVEWDRSLGDLERGVSAADEETWRAAAELAASLQATAAFEAGLRLIPAGRVLADRLELPGELSTDVALRANSPPPVALGLDHLAQAEGLRSRLTVLGHKLVPPPSFMRQWSRRARQGRLGLVLAYLWRPLWLLARLPAGFRAWHRARRLARRSGSNPQ
jgi:Uncharacterised nucleotidyltransferase